VPQPHLFLDCSALIAGVLSSTGAARALSLLAEASEITVTVSEQVIVETERVLARKAPGVLPYYREALRASGLQIVRDAPAADVGAHQGIRAHPADVPIVVAARWAGRHYLVTLIRRHFLDDPQVAVHTGLQIGTPGDALT